MQSTNLQGIGKNKAAPAERFHIGDTMVWNAGVTSKVVGIIKTTSKQIVFSLESENGTIHSRRMAKNRLVAF